MANTEERIIIVGGGSLAKELITWLIKANIHKNIDQRLFYIDDDLNEEIHLENISIKCLGKIRDIVPENDDKFYLGIANPIIKAKIVGFLDKKKANFCTFIHPSAIITKTTKIGRGCLIFPFSICSCNSILKDFITVNLHSAIGHDTVINSFTTISSFVDITGKVKIGEKVIIGSGARLLPSIKIGDLCTIGAGAILYRSVPQGKTAYCNPAKLL